MMVLIDEEGILVDRLDANKVGDTIYHIPCQWIELLIFYSMEGNFPK